MLMHALHSNLPPTKSDRKRPSAAEVATHFPAARFVSGRVMGHGRQTRVAVVHHRLAPEGACRRVVDARPP